MVFHNGSSYLTQSEHFYAKYFALRIQVEDATGKYLDQAGYPTSPQA
jgi:hypothetical protein